jgi:hypothetical protein
MSEGILDSDPTKALAVASQAEMVNWTHEKRKDFTDLFTARSEAAKFILDRCVAHLASIARNRKFISDKHTAELSKKGVNHNSGYYHHRDIGGRKADELEEIARTRAIEILKQLPPLKKAVGIIDKETAAKIDACDKLVKKGQALANQLAELSGRYDLADMDQDMTIGQFRQQARERDAKRRKILHNMDELGREATRIQSEIDTVLHKGIPGLSDAVIKVIVDHHERLKGLDQTTRRVVETVQFGDCEAAAGMLKSFEKDEVEVTANIKAEFTEALKKLKLVKPKPAKKTAKRLPRGKK